MLKRKLTSDIAAAIASTYYSMTVGSCHVTDALQSEPTLYSCLNVKELLS